MAVEITAPLSGKILTININAGDTVEEDDEAFVIEALKMETSVYVPCDGTVKEVKVSAEDEVEEDDVLAIIEE